MLQFQVKVRKFLLFTAILYLLVQLFFPDFETVFFLFLLTFWFENNKKLGETIVLLIIFISLSIITILTTYVKYNKYLQVLRLADFKEVRVIRKGKVIGIPSTDLVVGDLMFIDDGDIVPIDGVLFKSNDILCLEFGVQVFKRVPINYTEEEKCDPFITSGAKILDGHGVLIVCAVGINSVMGKIKLNQVRNNNDSIYLERETKLMKKLGIIFSDISKLGLIASLVTFVTMVIRMILSKLLSGDSLFTLQSCRSVLNSAMIMMAIVVVILPEGLEIALSSALTYAIVKMSEKNSVVKYFAACETLGYVNNIVSDQTGIFTKNNMTVSSLFIEECVYNSTKKIEQMNKDTIQLLCESICINSTATPKFWGNGEVERQGDEIECALLEFAYKLGYNYEKYRPNNSKIKRIQGEKGNEKRFVSCLYKNSDYDFRLFSHGIPKVILEKCNFYINYKGLKVKMNEEFRENVEKKIISSFSKYSLNPVALAYREITSRVHINSFEQLKEEEFSDAGNLVLIAIVGVKDPLRDEIPEAVALCDASGITVRMVTYDSVETAVSIAKDCGILPKTFDFPDCNNFSVMEGKDFRQYVGVAHNPYKPKGEELRIKDFQAFEEIISDLKVLARSTPEDKYLLISGLKEMGNFVALSGHGADDVNALRKADVGFAMGSTGSDIAKEVSDVILLDDNFSGIVNSIKWGRNLFAIIRRFLQLVLCIDLIFLAITFLESVIYSSRHFTAIHMIWIDFILNILSSFAFATETPPDDILARGPFNWNEYIITPFMRQMIIFQSIYGFGFLVFILLFSDYFDFFDDNVYEKKKTFVFNSLVFLIIFNQINSRNVKKKDYNVFRGFSQNKLFFLITFLMALMQIFVVQHGGIPLDCVPLTFQEFGFCVAVGAGSLVVGLIVRVLPEKSFGSFNFFKEEKRRSEFGDGFMEKLMGRQHNVLM